MNSNKKNMATYGLTIAFLLLGISFAGAQDSIAYKRAEAGIRFMPTVTAMDIKTADGGTVNGTATLGFGMGILLGYNFNNNIGIQAEILYSSITQKFVENDVEQQLNLRYVNIPLLLSLNTGKTKAINFNAVAGPQVGFNVGSSLSHSSEQNPDQPQALLSVKKGDIGFAYGAGIDFGLNPEKTIRLGMGYRGVLGLLDISDSSNTTTTEGYYVLDRSKLKTNAAYIGLSILF
ncbi:MAG: hypothetical protein ABR95_01490 [Sphingobacteriales bacterium BACL12 MAG-120813-bin55]|jgi:hypothetical protein|nr:MAG: hypothetical protein ABR95_01490 [Sphingobacteriales bacterium BACL12 MAG-120813-bin55]